MNLVSCSSNCGSDWKEPRKCTHCKNHIVNDSVSKEYIHLIYKIYTSQYDVNQFLYGLSKGYYQYSVIKVDAKRQIRLFLKESKEKIGV